MLPHNASPPSGPDTVVITNEPPVWPGLFYTRAKSCLLLAASGPPVSSSQHCPKGPSTDRMVCIPGLLLHSLSQSLNKSKTTVHLLTTSRPSIPPPCKISPEGEGKRSCMSLFLMHVRSTSKKGPRLRFRLLFSKAVIATSPYCPMASKLA